MMHRHQPAPQSPVKLPGRLPPEGQQAWVLALHLLALPTAHRPHPQHTAQCGLPPLLIPLLLPPVVPDAQHQMPVDAACSRCAARRLPQPPPHPCLPQSSRAAPGPPAGGVAPPCGAQRGAMRRRGGPRRSGPLCCTPPGQRGSPAAPACGQHGQAYSTAQRHLAGQSWCRADRTTHRRREPYNSAALCERQVLGRAMDTHRACIFAIRLLISWFSASLADRACGASKDYSVSAAPSRWSSKGALASSGSWPRTRIHTPAGICQVLPAGRGMHSTCRHLSWRILQAAHAWGSQACC